MFKGIAEDRCSKNFKLARCIRSLDDFYKALESEVSIFARHRMYPTAFFYSWPIKLIKEWVDKRCFWITRPLAKKDRRKYRRKYGD